MTMCHKLDYTCLLQSTMRGGLFEATAGRERMEWRNSATSRIYKIKASVHVYSFRQFTKDLTRSAVAGPDQRKIPAVFMRICQCLYVLSQMFCNVIPCTSLLSYIVIWKHTVIEALPDPYICRTLCPIHDS